MKKVLSLLLIGALFTCNASAQSKFTLNTRAWSTNYWTTLIYGAVHTTLGLLVFPDNETEYSRVIPDADLVFPVGLQKEGFELNDIYGSYHRAFSNPIKRPGDFGFGIDLSYKPGFVGFYLGGFFKSQEFCFVNDVNLRGLYLQPRAGMIIGSMADLEVGAYYDLAVAATGTIPSVNKAMLMSGFGLDIALSYSFVDKEKTMITFMMPLHNFLNEDYSGGAFKGMKRRVGYIMLTQRISF